MLTEIPTSRKQKITLTDYDYKKDIENRLLIANFSVQDVEVLEEILYSSIQIDTDKLASNLELSKEELFPILKTLSNTGLFSYNERQITVDKEKRKYFEGELVRFDPDFKPNMEFIQHFLKKVPIHVLPSWYALPRTSNNIFESLIEKYLLTPHIFQRHVNDQCQQDPLIEKIVTAVFQAENHRVFADELISKLHLSKEHFEEILLTLEFQFICCLSYVKEGSLWKEVVTPFQEWKDYLAVVAQRKIPLLPSSSKITRYRPRDFAFIEDTYRFLCLAKKTPFTLSSNIPDKEILKTLATHLGGFDSQDPLFASYIERIVLKLKKLKFAEEVKGKLHISESATEWLSMETEERAIALYRHPLNYIASKEAGHHTCHDKPVREAEKSILSIAGIGWVDFDTFIQKVNAPLSQGSTIKLEKHGKLWSYHLPEFTKEEVALIETTILDFFFEVGITAIGTCEEKRCFSVTPFGKTFFI